MLHNITTENEMLFYCRGCSQNTTKTERRMVDNVEYSVETCGCGNEAWTRKNFHRRTHADNEFFINLEFLMR